MGRGEDVLTPALLRDWPLPVADDGEDKHARGTVLVLGGAASTPGAVLLAGTAALRVGAGRLQVATTPETAAALGVALPEAKVDGVRLEQLGEAPLEGVAAVVVGPGLLSPEDAATVLEVLLPRLDGVALVVDALALAALPERVPGRAVLTPNPDELRHLASSDSDDLRALALEVAEARGAVVATLGWVAAPDGRCWRNEAGSVSLATSGSGDVLAGAVGGLLARGADPCQAACWATYLHSTAGDRLAATLGTGLLARELLDALPRELVALSA
jgi:hydroxyethylthiazole kinase-like uncharacterized protein yjeF